MTYKDKLKSLETQLFQLKHSAPHRGKDDKIEQLKARINQLKNLTHENKV